MKNIKNKEKLFDAISNIDQSDIDDYARYDERLPEPVPAKKERPVLKIIAVAAACLVIFGGISVGLKLMESRSDPVGPASSSAETDDTAAETEEIQVKKHVYKNEAPYAELIKYEFTPEEQEIADRYYNAMVENCPEFGKIPREKLWESVLFEGAGEYADYDFCIGSIGTDYRCEYNNHDYGIKEYEEFLNGWKISGDEFEQFVDFKLSQTVNDAIIELLKKNVRAYAEENGLQLARFVDRDPDDILERFGFHYDENGLYVQSVSIADSTDFPVPLIYACVGVEINGDTITLTEYPAALQPIFTTDRYEYSFTPSGVSADVEPPYAKPEKKEFTAEQKEMIDRVYNEMLEKYPDFGKIDRDMLLEDVLYAGNNTIVKFSFCLGGIPTSYQCTYTENAGGYKGWQILGEEFKAFSDWQIPEHSVSEIKSMLKEQTLLIMKAEKLDTDNFDLNKMSITWSVDGDGRLFANSEYIASVTEKTAGGYDKGRARVCNKVRVTIKDNNITLDGYPATTDADITKTEPESTDFADTREHNGRTYADNETFVGEYKTDRVSVSVSNVKDGDLSYYICDMILCSAEDFHTAFADSKISGMADTSETAKSVGAGFAVNGDFCGYRHTGIIIREGKLYRNEKADGWDLCCMDKNGDLITSKNDEEDGTALLNNGILQSWCFGPTLVKDHKALSNDEFCTPDLSKKDWAKESRTAIGQIDTLHYIIIVTDSERVSNGLGGWTTLGGMNFDELAAAFEALGCKTAYNLDGGGSTALYLNGKIVNEPCMGTEKQISDIIYLK